MTEEGTQQSAPAEQTSAEANLAQPAPSIMMDKDAASQMASEATEVNSIASSDPVEQGLNKGMKLSGIAGEKVATDDVSPIADVPADAQLNAEGSSPSATPNDESEESEAEEETTEEEATEEEADTEEETEAEEESESQEEEPEEDETEEEAEAEPEEEAEEEEPKEEEQPTEEQPPEASQPEEAPVEPEEEYTPFGDPLRNVAENIPQRNIDQKTQEDSEILLTDIPGKLRIY